METVQLAIRDGRYAAALQELLERGGSTRVHRVEAPDPSESGVIVVDAEGLNRLPSSLIHPERVVLVTRNDPQHLAQAWDAGIRSVVFSDDSLGTAVLAIMAAELRAAQGEPHPARPLGPSGASGCGPRRGT